MLIKELIQELEKVRDEYPDHEVVTRSGYFVIGVEACNKGFELVTASDSGRRGDAPKLATHPWRYGR